MTKIRKIALQPTPILLLALCFLLFSCKDSFNSEVKNSFTGEELFNGIFLARGPVAKEIATVDNQVKLTDLISTDDPKYKEAILFYDLIVKTIGEDNPSFFNNFKDNVYSGNHIVIKETLTKAANIYITAVQKISGLNENDLATLVNTVVSKNNLLSPNGSVSKENLKKFIQNATNSEVNSGSRSTCLAFAAIVAVAVIAVLAVIGMWGAVLVKWLIWPKTRIAEDNNSSLMLDQLINDIAVTLK